MRITAFTIFIFFIAIHFTACKSTSSPIVTSKKEAEKKGIYTPIAKFENKDIKKDPEQKATRNRRNTKPLETDYSETIDKTESVVDLLISTAFQYEGVRYKGGGMTNAGMDCSGLVCTTFKTHDIQLPRSSFEMAKVGEKIKLDQVQKGDLVFFKTNGRSQINHVGLVTEVRNGEVLFIHASVQRGVIVSSMNEPYYKKTFAQANRVLQ